MLRFSRSDDQLPYSRNNLPPNPPLTSILEQCFWNDNSSKFYYITKYNDRCALRNSPDIDEKYKKKSRPLTAQGRFCNFEKRERTKSFSQLTISDDSDDDQCSNSRPSTPDFMHEVYDTYSDLNSKNLLLRRPVSRCRNDHVNSENVSISNTKHIDASFLDSRVQFNQAFCNKNNLLQSQISQSILRKTVTVDIPICDKLSDAEESTLVPPLTSSSTQLDIPVEDEDETPGLPSPRTAEAHKSTSPAKKKTKKKKVVKKKAENLNSTSSLSRDKLNQQINQSKKIEDFVANDDVVTQMSALGLSKRRDEELTPVLLRKLPVPRLLNEKYSLPKSICHRRKKIPSSARACPTKSLKASEITSARRRRTIPIQIVSDPFKCSAANKKEATKFQRPHTASILPHYHFSDVARL